MVEQQACGKQKFALQMFENRSQKYISTDFKTFLKFIRERERQ